MKFTILKILVFNGKTKIVLVGLISGGLIQILSSKYIKSYSKSEIQKKLKKRKFRRFIKFLSKRGVLVGYIISSSVLITTIPLNVIRAYLVNAVPQNLVSYSNKPFIIVKGRKLYLNQSDQNLVFVYQVLISRDVSLKEKKQFATLILKKYFNTQTYSGKINIIVCIVLLLHIVTIQGSLYSPLVYKKL